MFSFSDIVEPLSRLQVEVPSWAYGNSGTRFKVFPQKGTPRTPFEKVADAAQVHRLTGLAPSVAIHIPWDAVDDMDELSSYAHSLGVRLGTVNSNTFQDEDYKYGSLCHPDPAVRRKAVEHNVACIQIMDRIGSRDLKIWLADGTNYPGQDDIRDRQERLSEGLAQIYPHLGEGQRMVLEYKLFEPAFYHTDVPDWGTSLLHCLELGPKAFVCLDTGHHAPGTNIEFIVAQLLRAGRLGSFDFNSRFYADDDLMVGAADPFQLFRILREVVRGGGYPSTDVQLMLDQCHNIENHIAGQIRSVLTVQEMLARALLVDQEELGQAQRACDVMAANQILMDAFYTDVRADLADWRVSQGLPSDPVAAFWASGYQESIEAERVGGTQAAWT
ncbi:MAG: L-rhamnose isomerase [Propionibacteriaceae bacterium]|nr:L-rhamnose isomerase [Propionibacteriaceae bacterium]